MISILKQAGFALLLLAGLYSCQDETYAPAADGDKEVTIILSVPRANEANGPLTYALPADEAKVNTVDVLAFKTDSEAPDDPSKGTFLYRAVVKHTPGDMEFTARLLEFSDKQTIVVLANCRAEVDALDGTIAMGETKANVITALTLSRNTAFDPAEMTGIPMWGEITDQQITASDNPAGKTVTLTRMLAKINIVNNDTENFTLQEAYLYNPRQRGSVIPGNWNGTNAVTAPTLVTGSGMPQGTYFTPLAPFTTSSDNRIEDKIYTFEADNASKAAGDLLDATCIIVGGNYRGSTDTYYYRIDLKNYATDTFFNLLRNHRYDITISSIDDEGTDNADQAYKGVSKIKASVKIWNQATGDVRYESNHLYVSQRYPWLKLDGTTEAFTGSRTLKIRTTHPDGWQWKQDAITLATLTDFKVTTTGGPANTEVPVEWSPDNITSVREGKAVIVSGNLEYTVYFIQDNCGRNGIALSQQIAKNTYKTHRYPTGTADAMECWMVENSMEGTYSGRGYGLDASGNSIGSISIGTRGSVNGYYYTWGNAITACPNGWSLPVNTQWTPLASAVNGDFGNTGKWWAGPLGTANNAFAGFASKSGATWDSWASSGHWWSKNGNFEERHYFGADSGDLSGPNKVTGTDVYWFSVRCVQDQK